MDKPPMLAPLHAGGSHMAEKPESAIVFIFSFRKFHQLNSWFSNLGQSQ